MRPDAAGGSARNEEPALRDDESQARWALVDAVFDEALDLPPDRRSGWLAARCGADAALRETVERLLAALEQPNPLLDGGAVPFAALAASLGGQSEGPRTIGPYRILREIGRGGMGIVYLADRNDGQFRHRVAIKVLPRGREGGELTRRFLAERQILATLSHPNVAQLLDGGITDAGLPYLVIEYVDGLPITTHCERNGLGLDARLRLFRAACAAVHHAHANLVLHLDVKPANILVTHDGQVKLLDFGIAKLLAPLPALEHDTLTHTAPRPLTPAYASPEQVAGGPLSTASDVYALGLVLYELLTGVRAQARGADGVLQAPALVEAMPPRPSQQASPSAGALRGDLDAIVMMALRREPERRYGSADLFSEDIGRYLDGQPVLAHRGSATYRLSKLARRHRVAAAGVLLAIVALITGTVTAAWQARLADREQRRATNALSEAEEVTRFLVGMFGPGQLVTGAEGTRVSVEQLVRNGAMRAEALRDRPLVQARMFEALAQINFNLGNLAAADTFGLRAVRTWSASLGDSDLRVADAMTQLAEIQRHTGAYASADSLLVSALAIRRARLGDRHADVASALRQRSMMQVYLNDLDQATALIREAVTIRRGLADGDSALVDDLRTLGSTLWRRGLHAEALRSYRESADLALRHFPRPHESRIRAQMRLAERLVLDPSQQGERIALARAALAEARELVGEAAPLTATTLSDAAGVLRTTAPQEAEVMYRQAVEIQRRVAPGLAGTAFALTQLAWHLATSTDRYREAEGLQREAITILTAQYGPGHSVVAGALGTLGEILQHAGRYAEAEQVLGDALARRRAALGADNATTAYTALTLAHVVRARGAVSLADSIFADSRAALARALGDGHPDVRRIDSVRAALRREPGAARVLPPVPRPQ